MKKRLKLVLIFIGVILLSIGIMVGSAYIYLEASLRADNTDNSQENIPYTAPLPDSVGVLFLLPDNCGYLFYLGFADDELLITTVTDYDGDKDYYGYTATYEILCDYTFLAEFIDRLGGIELYDSGKTLRYTGIQIIDKIYTGSNNSDLKKEVVRRVFEKIADVGITKEDFSFIISSTETNLTVPYCYYWPPYLTEIAEKTRFIN